MTVHKRHKVNGSADPEGRWGIHRIVDGQPVYELYPDFNSATWRLGKIAREMRRRSTQRRRGGRPR